MGGFWLVPSGIGRGNFSTLGAGPYEVKLGEDPQMAVAFWLGLCQDMLAEC